MNPLDPDALTPTTTTRLLARVVAALGPVSRRQLLVRGAVAGSALAVHPVSYLGRPGTAYDSVCGPANTFAGGYSVFCCTVNKGVNACPPGSFMGGWWKAADSSWCGGGYRYLVDCNAECTGCTTGCSGDHICDTSCWNCSCSAGSSATCDQRRHCCNAFRYGQCNTQVGCSGGVNCRVVSCVPPYEWASCSTTSFSDDSTAEHSAPCEQQWGQIAERYDSLGANGSYLGASTGPVHEVGDGGNYVAYQYGSIYWSSATGAWSIGGAALSQWRAYGATGGVLGYPTSERADHGSTGWYQLFHGGMICDSTATVTRAVYGATYEEYVRYGRELGVLGYPTYERAAHGSTGWVQLFENGIIADSVHTHTKAVYGAAYDEYVRYGRELGVLGYPTYERAAHGSTGWVQLFENGIIADSVHTHTKAVYGAAYDEYVRYGRELGVLGYPTYERADHGSTGWVQLFENGVIADSVHTHTKAVYGATYDCYVRHGRELGDLGYPTYERAAHGSTGLVQLFQYGIIADSTRTVTSAVSGAAYDEYVLHGRELGVLGYPAADRVTRSDGSWYQLFENGMICDSTRTSTRAVYGATYEKYASLGRETGPLGYPTYERAAHGTTGWVQLFEHGIIADSTRTVTTAVDGVFYPAYQALGREYGSYGYPVAASHAGRDGRGHGQTFQGGQLWSLGAGAAYSVYGAVLSAWNAAGAETGRYGYPVSNTTANGAGGFTCRFEHGTITT